MSLHLRRFVKDGFNVSVALTRDEALLLAFRVGCTKDKCLGRRNLVCSDQHGRLLTEPHYERLQLAAQCALLAYIDDKKVTASERK